MDMKTIEVVAAVIKQGDAILATQRGYGDFAGGWEFPGGKIEPGETPEQALVREIHEELEATVAVEKRKNCLRKLCCSCILDENSFPFSGVPHFIFPKNIISEEKSFVKMGYCEVKGGGV